MRKWFLVYCRPNQDARAEENLIRQGFEIFRPTVAVVKSRIGCQDSIKRESLFYRYIFLRADPTVVSLSPVTSTYGVASFVKFGAHYATMPDHLIDEIKANADTQIALIADRDTLKSGDAVYLDGHGFDQVRAIYCSPCGETRATILMTILGNESRLDVPKACITKRVI